MSHVAHINESCHTYCKVIPHIWGHITHLKESCHIYEGLMSHIWMSHGTHMRALIWDNLRIARKIFEMSHVLPTRNWSHPYFSSAGRKFGHPVWMKNNQKWKNKEKWTKANEKLNQRTERSRNESYTYMWHYWSNTHICDIIDQIHIYVTNMRARRVGVVYLHGAWWGDIYHLYHIYVFFHSHEQVNSQIIIVYITRI